MIEIMNLFIINFAFSCRLFSLTFDIIRIQNTFVQNLDKTGILSRMKLDLDIYKMFDV